MKEEHFKWYSPNLSMETEMLVYGHAGQPVLIFPTTQGRYYESKDFKLIESVKWFVDQGLVQIFRRSRLDRKILNDLRNLARQEIHWRTYELFPHRGCT